MDLGGTVAAFREAAQPCRADALTGADVAHDDQQRLAAPDGGACAAGVSLHRRSNLIGAHVLFCERVRSGDDPQSVAGA
jgi:hypothetical protein